ncbi:MAG TPA: biopolymer transporter ExbD [Verrucomicrobiota bacterium]|nr:biopolymer transporter ExbD [Verrucomicrobiota bacterium]
MRYARNARIFRGQIDFAPIASVLFLLVIFLLLNSGLVFTPGVRIDLPAALPESLPGVAGPTVVVAVDRDGLCYFDHQIITTDALRNRLQAIHRERANLTMVLQADKAVSYEVIVRLSQMAREIGIREVLLGTRPPLLQGTVTNEP